VPVSTIILTGEILLCAMGLSGLPTQPVGQILQAMIGWMNDYVERFNGLPVSVADHLYINIPQVILLYIFITGMAFWLMSRLSYCLHISLASLIIFLGIRSFSFYNAGGQHMLVIYNISRSAAVEYIKGRNLVFFGDANTIKNKSVFNFNIYPAHVLWRLGKYDSILALRSFTVSGKVVFVMDGRNRIKEKPDIVIITGKIMNREKLFNGAVPSAVVIDSSVPAWKSERIKKQLDEQNISYHDVSEKGAFLMQL
jgi:competence protein ComEC